MLIGIELLLELDELEAPFTGQLMTQKRQKNITKLELSAEYTRLDQCTIQDFKSSIRVDESPRVRPAVWKKLRDYFFDTRATVSTSR